VRGAHVTLGLGRQRVTIAVPGTGMSYGTAGKTTRAAPGPSTVNAISGLVLIIFVAIILWRMAAGR
jgi:hypothetical protein